MEYAKQIGQFEAQNVEVVALSVDSPSKSSELRRKLELPFDLICDPSRSVVKAWGLFNPNEGGGIAYPAVFLIGSDGAVQFRSLDRKASRVMPNAVLEVIGAENSAAVAPPRSDVRADPVTALKYLGWVAKRALGMNTD